MRHYPLVETHYPKRLSEHSRLTLTLAANDLVYEILQSLVYEILQSSMLVKVK